MSKSDNLMGVKFVSTEFHFITAGLKLIFGGGKKKSANECSYTAVKS